MARLWNRREIEIKSKMKAQIDAKNRIEQQGTDWEGMSYMEVYRLQAFRGAIYKQSSICRLAFIYDFYKQGFNVTAKMMPMMCTLF